ncbi:MAG: RNA polymerase sigma factor [Thermomicrobia bacterium]|nr:RNA polymerase sigma factor [Thermomicrobia bacterium]
METPKHTPQRPMDAGEPPAGGLTPAAFAASYRAYAVPLYRYFYQHTGNAADAEDLTAATIGKALASLASYAGRAPLAAWLFGIACHTLQGFQRRRGAPLALDALAASLADAGPLPEQHVVACERGDNLHARIRALPANQREALTLRYFGALPIAEIAVLLDRSDGAVKLLIHRALTTLRAQYRQEDQQ